MNPTINPTHYICAILGTLTISGGLIALITLWMPNNANSASAITIIISMATPTLAALISGLKSFENSKMLKHLHTCTHEMKEEAIKAKEAAVETKADVMKAVQASNDKPTEVNVHIDGDKAQAK